MWLNLITAFDITMHLNGCVQKKEKSWWPFWGLWTEALFQPSDQREQFTNLSNQSTKVVTAHWPLIKRSEVPVKRRMELWRGRYSACVHTMLTHAKCSNAPWSPDLCPSVSPRAEQLAAATPCQLRNRIASNCTITYPLQYISLLTNFQISIASFNRFTDFQESRLTRHSACSRVTPDTGPDIGTVLSLKRKIH